MTGSANETQMHTQVTHTPLTEESDSQIFLFGRRIRGEGEEGPSDAAITTTLSGQACRKKYFSQEISMGACGGGLAHLGTGTHANTCMHTEIHNTHWLPEFFTSQTQMPQLSHQHHCANVANQYAQ